MKLNIIILKAGKAFFKDIKGIIETELKAVVALRGIKRYMMKKV